MIDIKQIIDELKAIEADLLTMKERCYRIRKILEEDSSSSSTRKGRQGLSDEVKAQLIADRRRKVFKKSEK